MKLSSPIQLTLLESEKYEVNWDHQTQITEVELVEVEKLGRASLSPTGGMRTFNDGGSIRARDNHGGERSNRIAETVFQ